LGLLTILVVVFLLKPSRSHQEFQEFLMEQIKLHYFEKDCGGTILLFYRELTRVWFTDLTEVSNITRFRYSLRRGAPARDPVDMFRSLFLMEMTRCNSIDDWVKELKAFPFWAIFSGFSPGNVPGVGTFYDFMKRLWLADSPYLSKKVRKRKRKPKKGKKKGEKAPIRKPGIVKRLVDRFLSRPPVFKTRPHDLLQKIFKECFVLPSAKLGLLGDIEHLRIAGDGSSVRTGASRYGKMTCTCRKQGVFNCRCPRRYSDPDASWGWDSYREEYYYGRGLYAFSAADSPYDLPVYLLFHKAERHDSVAFVPSFFDFMHLYPEFRFEECLLDSAHDAYAIYELLHHFDMSAVIDLNKRNAGNISCDGEFTFNKDGLPLCRAGHIMAYHGYCKDRQRHKWRCPMTRKKWNIKCDNPCSDSKYGRVFYTREQDNLRYFTRIPRDTPQWKTRYKRRTTIERCFKRLKEDYLLERRGKIRSSMAWYFRAFVASMCLHTDAWVSHQSLDIRPMILQWGSETNSQAA